MASKKKSKRVPSKKVQSSGLVPNSGGLTRETILREALALADEGGIESLSMRKLAARLGVEAMSLYHHVKNKDAVLDGLVDLLFAEVEQPSRGTLKSKLRRRCASLRKVLMRHRWATSLLDSHAQEGPNKLAHHDWCVGTMLRGGFPLEGVVHAFLLLDSYVYGFVVQEVALPSPDRAEARSAADAFDEERYPSLDQLAAYHTEKGLRMDREFEFGLALILDGLSAKFDA